MRSRFWSSLGLSATLHTVAFGVIQWGGSLAPAAAPVRTSEPLQFQGTDLGEASLVAPLLLPVQLESEAVAHLERAEAERDPVPQESEPTRSASRGATAALEKPVLAADERAVPTPRVREVRGGDMAEPRPPQKQTLPLPSATPNVVDRGSTEGAKLTPKALPIDRATLHQAMVDASAASASGSSTYTQPVVRVDPSEKNLDRAFARAFAWAFAVDRSFFSAPPVGRARFVVELADDGKISGLHWPEPNAPERLKQLIQRMARLLSVNRFELSTIAAGDSARREFALAVAESHVQVPAEAAVRNGQAGDIWMLGAGETPTVGRPSHPSVADITGHRFVGELRIVDHLPKRP